MALEQATAQHREALRLLGLLDQNKQAQLQLIRDALAELRVEIVSTRRGSA